MQSFITFNRYFRRRFNKCIKKIKFELSTYDKNLAKKKEIIFFNKSDLLDEKEINKKLSEFKKKIKSKYEIISIYSNKDIKKKKKILIKNAH